MRSACFAAKMHLFRAPKSSHVGPTNHAGSRENMQTKHLHTGVVVQFRRSRDAHRSSLGADALLPLVERKQLLPENEVRALRDAARKTTDGRLSDSALVGDPRLHETPGDEVSDQGLPVHGSSPKHRYADIVHRGMPIVNIGKLMHVNNRDRTPFGQRLFDARKAVGLSQAQVAAHLKMSQGTIAELEKKGHGSSRTIEFATLLGCDANWLATGEGESVPPPPPLPPRDFSDRREVSESDWATLEALNLLPDEDRAELLETIRARASKYAAYLAQRMKVWESAPSGDRESLRPTSDDGAPHRPGERLIQENKPGRRSVK
jgi:transcriptional regulator with XRE-family HTH domain